MARHAIRPRKHPSFTGQSLARAGVRLLGVAGRDSRTGDSRAHRDVFGASQKKSAGSPTISTSKGTMPAWSCSVAGHWESHSHQGRSARCWSSTSLLILQPAHRTPPAVKDICAQVSTTGVPGRISTPWRPSCTSTTRPPSAGRSSGGSATSGIPYTSRSRSPRRSRPSPRTIPTPCSSFVTGELAAAEQSDRVWRTLGRPVLQKPFDLTQLEQYVSDAARRDGT